MKCQKCKNEIDTQGNTCPYCNNFLYRPILKEILRIVKKYYIQQDYSSIKDLLYKAKNISKYTKYEKYINNQIANVEKQIIEQQEEINNLKLEAVEAIKEKKLRTALELYRKILEFPLKFKEKRKIENELLRIKAHIYRFEMKDLIGSNDEIFEVSELL